LPLTAGPGQARTAGELACDSREEIFMVQGILIAESLRVGTNLAHLRLTVRKISKYQAQGTTPDQPGVWTTLDFEAEESEAEELARAFADALDQPGWYVNFESPAQSFVVFPGRIFRYPRGDKAGRAEAQAYGRQLAIPEPQLDWTV
jgi:hypothetical protein